MATLSVELSENRESSDQKPARSPSLADEMPRSRPAWMHPLFLGLAGLFLLAGLAALFGPSLSLLAGEDAGREAGQKELAGWLYCGLVLLLAVPALVITGWLLGRLSRARRDLAMMQAAFDAAPQARAVACSDGRLKYANLPFVNLLSLSSPAVKEGMGAPGGNGSCALSGAGPSGLMPLLDGEEAEGLFRGLLADAASGRSGTVELPFRSPDGARSWREITVLPIGPERALWRVDDVTLRRLERDRWMGEHGRLAELVDELPVGVYSVDETGRFLFVNRTFASWLGCEIDMLTGGSLRLADVMADRRGKNQAAHDPYTRAEEEDRTLVRFLTREGEILETRVHQVVEESPAIDPVDLDPVEEGWAQDITIRTRTVVRKLSTKGDWEEALRRSEHRFQQIFENAPVGILLADPSANVSAANKAFREMVQPTRSRIVGQPLLGFIEAEHQPLLQQRLKDIEEGKRLAGALEVKLTGKASIPAAVFVSQTEDVLGNATGFILHFLDATEQKRLELQFAQSQKMQAVGQLAGGVAHDFNNMLTAITGHCDLLMQRHHPGEAEFSDISQIRNASNRAANLVRQLLAFSRQQALRPQVLQLTDALAELTHLLRRLIGENIKLNIIHGRDLFPVRVDISQLENVVINLAVNARDAMNEPGRPPGGMLTIRTDNVTMERPLRRLTEEMPAGDYVLIEVTDTGCGIPQENVERVFEPFFTTKEVGSGTGLGLSTVYGIIKQFDGFVFVDSKMGEGTTFSIYLPRHIQTEGEVKPVVITQDSQPAGDLTGSGTVLLVEDEDAVRLFSARALRHKGYQVLEAVSGEQALQMLDEQAKVVDLLITDVVMPQMDGPEMVRLVREKHPDLKVIFISGYAEDNFRERLDQDSDIHFLPKPFSLKQLAGKVRDVLRKGS